MAYLIAGIVLFFGMHLVPTAPRLKAALVTRLGEKGYRAAFSLVAFAGLGLIIWGRASTGHYAIYHPPAWGHAAALVLMLPAFILLAAANMKGHIRKATRHPMLLGALLWALAHLLANGDLISIWLFASFAVFSLVDMVLASRRGPAPDFAIKPRQDVVAVLAGLAVYLIFVLFAHKLLFGVKII